MSREVAEKSFAFIPFPKAEFFEKENLFGDSVHQKFPSMGPHIKNAGNCLAADLNTAAVYHLMCVVELGLRALAKQLHVKTVRKKTPIELGTWEDVISALEQQVGARHPRTRKGQSDAEFYNGLFIEYRAFKDIWRNRVMHTRADYDEFAARSAFDT